MRSIARLAFGLATLAFAAARPAPAQAGALLDAIKARGVVICGVSQDSPGNAMADSHGHIVEFHADI